MDHTIPALVTPLVGRQEQLDLIRTALAGATTQGAALHLQGDPGIGKSALLAAGGELARSGGFTVLTAVGSEAEHHLPFAALHELLRPMLDDLSDLPAEHRGSLTRAFGLSAWRTSPDGLDLGSDRFFLSLAVVQLLSSSATQAPLLLIADDVQWWDTASREVLAFVSRRIATIPAVLLTASRPDSTGSPADLGSGTAVPLPGLSPESALLLLREHGGELTPDDEHLVLQVAEGNPLALIELPVSLTRHVGPPPALPVLGRADVLPLTSRLERAFAVRLTELSPASRRVLLVAASLDGDLLAETAAALATTSPTEDAYAALDDVVTTGLVTIDDHRLRFRHPLVRSVVVQLATAGDRRAAHHALALSQTAQPDRAAWHRAAAAPGPDEDVATALDLAAEHAMERGAPGVAAALFERAAALSVEDRRRGHRLLRAAELAFELGRQDVSERLLGETTVLALDEADRARLVGLRAVFDGAPGSADDIRLIVSSAEAVLATGDRSLAAYLLVGAARRCLWSSAQDDVRKLVLDAAAISLPDGDPRRMQITAFVDPLGRGTELVSQLEAWAERPVPDPATGTLLGIASFLVADFDRTLTFVARSRDGLRQQGRTELLAQALAVQSMAGVYVGHFPEAHEAAETAYALTLETRQPIWRALATFALSHLEAIHGHDVAASALTDEAEETAVRTGNRALLNRLQFARGLNALGVGRPETAFAELRRMLDSTDLAFQRSQAVCGVGYLAESATTETERDEARTLLAQVETLTRHTSASGVRRAVVLAQAVLAPDDLAEQRFREATAWMAGAAPWYRARLDLALGDWLRRQDRTTESRRALRSAWAVFRALDTPAWATRAEHELTALEPSGDRSLPGRQALSGQETQVARLAAAGLSNREIAEQLHLSTRTVASHLYRIFPKLGVHSRSQLHLALDDRVQAWSSARRRDH